MSTESLYIAYDGPALQAHEMDVRVLAPALLAFSDLFEEANAVLNGDRAKARLNVKGSFKTGSFGFELSVSQSLLQSLLDFGTKHEIISAVTLLSLLGFCSKAYKGLIQVLQWISGRKVEKIEINGKIATLYIDQDHLEIEERILKLLRNERIRRAIDDAIAKPLEVDGIDCFGFTDKPDNKDNLVLIEKKESCSFKYAQFNSYKSGTSEYDITLKIIGISFQENNKWKFYDGTTTPFYASIADEEFLSRIDNHTEQFGKGDEICAHVKEKIITKSNGNPSYDRVISKVLSHKKFQQDSLLGETVPINNTEDTE